MVVLVVLDHQYAGNSDGRISLDVSAVVLGIF